MRAFTSAVGHVADTVLDGFSTLKEEVKDGGNLLKPDIFSFNQEEKKQDFNFANDIKNKNINLEGFKSVKMHSGRLFAKKNAWYKKA